LSLASLSYARRVTQELGLTNIDYQQADILRLAASDRRFDVIESCGVLHHMSDPLEGWRILANLLRPNGYMKIGLYSRRARRDVSTARRFIAERGYPPTPEGIRQCRSAMVAEDSGFASSRVLASADFYSTSACRDLLFHVEEHVFSPAEIERHLDQLGLELLGFELNDPDVKRRYQARFPEDAACVSLANWELFEQDNPDTFINLYEFWARA
jgi:SAM-dependent methyltransferase